MTMMADSLRTFELMLTPPVSKDPVARANDVRLLMRATLDLPARLEVVQGEFLAEVTDNKWYKDWGFKSFEDYVTNELGFKVRKAEILVAIFRKFCVELEIEPPRLQTIEWTKARELLPVIDKENVDDLLHKVQDMSVRQVKEMVRDMRGITSEDREKMVTMNFKFSLDQYEIVKQALSVAKGMSESDRLSHNLHLICTDFLSTLDGQTIPLDLLLRSIESNYQIKLQVVKEVANESSPVHNGFGEH